MLWPIMSITSVSCWARAQHTGIGTDLDGGYGNEQTPNDLDTIADLEKFLAILRNRGYSQDDLTRICHQNFITFLQRAWS